MEKFLIDVSEHNGLINWNQAKKHIDGAILRCGYGMDIPGQDDKQWARNVSECERLGIPYGVYLYSYADTADKARSEARHVLRLIKGRRLSYPVYYDLEESKIESAAVENAKIFGDIIEVAGYWCGVYYNRDWHERIIQGRLDRFTRWGAGYGTNDGRAQTNYKPGFGEDIWQYSSAGSVPGISGKVDVNKCYRDFPSEINGKQEREEENYMFEVRELRAGDRGNEVLLLQEILKARGFYKGPLHSRFDRAVMVAVNAYQEKRKNDGYNFGSPNGNPNGIVSRNMWKDLLAL